MTRERTIEADAKRDIEAAGGWVLKWKSPGQNGVPDRIVFWPETMHFVEFKRPKGTPRSNQVTVHKRLLTYGHRVVVLDSREAVAAYIKKYGP